MSFPETFNTFSLPKNFRKNVSSFTEELPLTSNPADIHHLPASDCSSSQRAENKPSLKKKKNQQKTPWLNKNSSRISCFSEFSSSSEWKQKFLLKINESPASVRRFVPDNNLRAINPSFFCTAESEQRLPSNLAFKIKAWVDFEDKMRYYSRSYSHLTLTY